MRRGRCGQRGSDTRRAAAVLCARLQRRAASGEGVARSDKDAAR